MAVMIDLNEVQVFCRVVEAGTFTAAARAIDVRKSTISRKVSSLEERLGVRLLHRTTRQLRLTEAGATFYERVSRTLTDLNEAARDVTDSQSDPRGHLRVTAPVDIGMMYVSPVIASFLAKYPDIDVDLVLTERIVDVVDEGYDVAIRAGSMPDSSLVVRQLGRTAIRIVASPAYLAASPPITEPSDLSSHTFLMFDRSPFGGTLTLRHGDKTFSFRPRRRFKCNNFSPLTESAIAGLGLAVVPDFHSNAHCREGRLKAVLPAWQCGGGRIYAVYPSRRLVAAKVRSFLDFLSTAWRQDSRFSPPSMP